MKDYCPVLQVNSTHVFVAGGCGPDGAPRSSAFLFDLRTGKVTDLLPLRFGKAAPACAKVSQFTKIGFAFGRRYA